MLRSACAVMFVVLGALVTTIGCVPPPPSSGSSDAVAPASSGAAVEDAATAEAEQQPPAKLYGSGELEDNQACLVCHLDLEEEKISAVHLEKAGMTCASCHGDSEAHRGDEWNIIRPDVIWGRAEMGPFCKQCHPKHTESEAYSEFLDEWLDKRRPTGRWVKEDSPCLDCHGSHAVIIPENEFK